MLLAPPWALFGGAIDAKNVPNPHLASGVHLRVLPSPTIGLPSTPLFVSRFEVGGASSTDLKRRSDIRWTDATGTVLTAPFSLPIDPANPVTGWLPGPPSGTCIWISVLGHFSIGLGGGTASPTNPPFRLEGWVSNPRGASLVGTSASLFVLSAPRIDFVVIRPQPDVAFTVDAVSWIAAEDVPLSRFVPWRVWSLPIGAAPRYQPTATAQADAAARVTRGAPPHQPLFINPVDGGPSASPAATPAAETARIATLSPFIAPRVTKLMTDLSAAQAELSETHAFDDSNLSGTAGIPLLGYVLQSSTDPGVGRWLGFGDVDEAPPNPGVSSSSSSSVGSNGPSIVFYLVRGLWPERSDLFDQLLLKPALVKPGTSLAASFPELASLGGLPSSPSRFYDLGIILAVTLGEAPDVPDPPSIDGIDDFGWRADVPLTPPRRAVEVDVSGVNPVAEIALAVADTGVDTRTLNPRLGPNGVVQPGDPAYNAALPLPLAASVDPTTGTTGVGHFQDRNALEGGGQYRIAQSDLFGRWSEWARVSAGPFARTPPPAPVLELHYLAPTLAASDTAPEAGTFTVIVSVPSPNELPPGARSLVDLQLAMIVNGVATPVQTFPLPASSGTFGNVTLNPAPTDQAPGVLSIQFTGPALNPAAGADVKFVGTWGDGSVRSADGTAKRHITDPRPVPPPVMPTDLIYARRPDARGQARVELPFPTGSPNVRIYYTTETTILRGLELLQASTDPNAGNAGTALTEIQAASEGSPRAQAVGKWKNLLDYAMFENLTPAPFSPSGAGLLFPHVLSASLTGLALYRVLSVTPSGVMSDFATSPLVAAMVPNFGAPARPFVRAFLQLPAEGGSVLIEVKVSSGTIAPAAFRVRRATQPYPDERQMLVVNAGQLAAPTTGSWLHTPAATGPQGSSFTLVDPGPFINWRRYFWSVELQSGPPPGAPPAGAPAGEWSLPSSPGSVEIIPTNPPGAPDSVVAQRVGSDVTITITATGSAAVVGTRIGGFKVEVFRIAAGARPVAVAATPVSVDPATFTVTDLAAPSSVTYAARIVDPVGRRGTFTSSGTPV